MRLEKTHPDLLNFTRVILLNLVLFFPFLYPLFPHFLSQQTDRQTVFFFSNILKSCFIFHHFPFSFSSSFPLNTHISSLPRWQTVRGKITHFSAFKVQEICSGKKKTKHNREVYHENVLTCIKAEKSRASQEPTTALCLLSTEDIVLPLFFLPSCSFLGELTSSPCSQGHSLFCPRTWK